MQWLELIRMSLEDDCKYRNENLIYNLLGCAYDYLWRQIETHTDYLEDVPIDCDFYAVDQNTIHLYSTETNALVHSRCPFWFVVIVFITYRLQYLIHLRLPQCLKQNLDYIELPGPTSVYQHTCDYLYDVHHIPKDLVYILSEYVGQPWYPSRKPC